MCFSGFFLYLYMFLTYFNFAYKSLNKINVRVISPIEIVCPPFWKTLPQPSLILYLERSNLNYSSLTEKRIHSYPLLWKDLLKALFWWQTLAMQVIYDHDLVVDFLKCIFNSESVLVIKIFRICKFFGVIEQSIE